MLHLTSTFSKETKVLNEQYAFRSILRRGSTDKNDSNKLTTLGVNLQRIDSWQDRHLTWIYIQRTSVSLL